MNSNSHIVRFCSLLAEMGIGFQLRHYDPSGGRHVVAHEAGFSEVTLDVPQEVSDDGKLKDDSCVTFTFDGDTGEVMAFPTMHPDLRSPEEIARAKCSA